MAVDLSSAAASGASAPLRDLLESLAVETDELARCADGLQELFGRLIGSRPASDALEQAQALDGLAQRLDGLHTFLAGLSGRPLSDLREDAAQAATALPLTRQARRFGDIGARSYEKPAGGDCDLF